MGFNVWVFSLILKFRGCRHDFVGNEDRGMCGFLDQNKYLGRVLETIAASN